MNKQALRTGAVMMTLVIIGSLLSTFTMAGSAGAVTYSGPIVITSGGTYSGAWESTSAGTPAVKIATTQPVILENCYIKGPGTLILNQYVSSDVTVRNCAGEGVLGASDNRFMKSDSGFRRVIVENNTLTNTHGMWFNAPGITDAIIKVTGNKSIDIGLGATQNVCFVQLSHVTSRNVEIAWNEVVNRPDRSKVEDNINVFDSGSPDATKPIWIHDNFIWGGFPIPGATNQNYSGGGIMVGDNGSTNGRNVVVENNQVIGTTNYGISIVCGSDQIVRNNRVLASGTMPDGVTWLAGMNVGLSLASEARWGAGCTTFSNNSMSGNTVGWVRGPNSRWGAGRADWWTPDALTPGSSFTNNTSYGPGNPTYSTEQAEYTRWAQKLTTAGRTTGSVNGTSPTTSSTSTSTSSTSTTAAPTTTTTAPTPAPVTVQLSALTPSAATNGLGPFEKNMSNGGGAAGDGRALSIRGTRYGSGLGVSANSSLSYNLAGSYRTFNASVGIDDEVLTKSNTTGSVAFKVYVDGTLRYQSSKRTSKSQVLRVTVDVTGASTLRLVVTDAGDGNAADHADWADAKLIR